MTTAITTIVDVKAGGIIIVRIPDVAATGWGVIPARICAVAGATIPNAVAATIPRVGAMITAPNAGSTATTTGMTEGGLGYAETEMKTLETLNAAATLLNQEKQTDHRILWTLWTYWDKRK